MPITAPQNRAQLAGLPGQWQDTITGSHAHLISGDTPPVVTKDYPLDLNQTLAAYTPVKWNAGGTGLVAATSGDPVVGITLMDHTVPNSGARPGAPVLIQGTLNPEALTWPASFDTDAKRMAAFNGAAAPTNIVLKRVYRGSVIAQP